jgi:hypothetical protein
METWNNKKKKEANLKKDDQLFSAICCSIAHAPEIGWPMHSHQHLTENS